jgi:hypothetical protein
MRSSPNGWGRWSYELTPTLPDILTGQFAALTAPAPADAGGDYAAARVGMIGMLAALATQEVERGAAARVWENEAMAGVLAAASAAYDQALGGRLANAARAQPRDLTWSGLDARNAELRRLLIALHEAVEATGDSALDRKILHLYRGMAQARRLDLPAALGG